MSKQQNPTNQAAKSEDATKAKAKAERSAKKQAKRAKRIAKLQDINKEQGSLAMNTRLTFREWRDGITIQVDGKPVQILTPAENDKSWKAYCSFKAAVLAKYWLAQAEKPQVSEKALARKKARLEKAKAAYAKLEAELAELEQLEKPESK